MQLSDNRGKYGGARRNLDATDFSAEHSDKLLLWQILDGHIGTHFCTDF
jgi:hypothetical protein